MRSQKNMEDWSTPEAWITAELVEQSKKNAKRWFLAFLIAMLFLFTTNLYWITVFESYEYVSQDGSGLNNINTGYQGDLINGAENETEEEWSK